ncbi:hypothetical protein TUZN_0029 [Thermoproteus uzoniensis 768-20]|uniref:Protein-glutamine gamma-glutamyltransferase-like C-terminal domain-containing protein n=1 Tax=Thermoproteus uzoniensis (strain 768-20) TaxID=999630 RepID=F2L0Y6_THEU7|nr:DUF4129 domain-containing protein [Thermoproteus uzoniensis]AEA11535.1 hypothetical protein TUZN_0029 [Thermoproteus uzoniensis 768-20]
MRRLALALSTAVVLLLLALHKPLGPVLSAPQSLQQLAELVKSNPDLLSEALRFISELHLNVTLPTAAGPRTTSITLTLNASQAVAGSYLEASGALTSGGRPLGGQPVVIYVDGVATALAVTGPDGKYLAIFKLAAYKSTVNVTAAYLPQPGSAYGPSTASVQLPVIYNATELVIEAPREVLWGAPLNITIYQSPPVPRSVILSISNGTWKVVLTRHIVYAATFDVPTSVLTPGNYTVIARAEGAGAYAPATASIVVRIVAELPKIDISAPPIAVAGAPLEVALSVQPRLNASLSIDGRPYAGAIPLEVPTGFVAVSVTTPPSPPYWASSASVEVFVLNPLQISAAIAVVLLAVKMASRLPRRSGVAAATVEMAAAPQRTFATEAGEALEMLAKAFFKLGERSGVRYKRTMTYREYAKAVERHAADRDCLWRLVRLAERAVYSPNPLDRAEIEAARPCIERL